MSSRTVYNPSHPCPVCRTGTKGCNSLPDGLHNCRGTPGPEWRLLKETDNNGFCCYRHEDDLERSRQSHQDRKACGLAPKPKPAKPTKPFIDWAKLAHQFAARLTPELRAELALRLGVPVSALEAVSLLGYVQEPVYLLDGQPIDKSHWTFPETDGAGNIIGIAQRFRKECIEPGEDDKKSMFGGNRGLIVATDLANHPGPDFWFEGASCKIAATAAGLCASSRPGNAAGAEHIVAFYKNLPGNPNLPGAPLANRRIIIVGENDQKPNGDWPGRTGAITTATKVTAALAELGCSVEWTLPPDDVKDCREYLRDGDDAWPTGTPWNVRGAELAAQLVANVVRVEPQDLPAQPTPAAPSNPIGYADLTDAEARELMRETAAQMAAELAAKPVAPDVTPEECAVYAAEDIRDEIKLSCNCMHCRNKSPILLETDAGRPFVWDAPCGNNKLCRNCLNKNVYTKVVEGVNYMERTSIPQFEIESDTPRTLYTALVDASLVPEVKLWDSLTRRIRDMGGERFSILTDDPEGVATRLGRTPDTSGFFLKDNKKVDGESGDEPETRRLLIVSLPHRTDDVLVLTGGIKLRRTPTANTMRALYHGAKTVPPAPIDDDTKFKPYHQSNGWGDQEARPPSTVKVVRLLKFKRSEVLRILTESGVDTFDVPFGSRAGSEPGLSWALIGAQSLAVCLWLGAVDAPEVPTAERVTELIRHWLPHLQGFGKGYHVEQVLRKHIWHLGLFDISDELRTADAEDKARADVEYEAASILRGLKEHYKGREHEATGLIKLLLA